MSAQGEHKFKRKQCVAPGSKKHLQGTEEKGKGRRKKRGNIKYERVHCG